jgi:predicted PurR-regulated permease PerM
MEIDREVTTPTSPPASNGPGERRALPERVVVFRVRSILAALGIVLGILVTLEFILLAQAGLTLIAVALFLALALDPAVNFFARRVPRGVAVGAVSALALALFALLGLVLGPPLVDQISGFVKALPDLVADLTKGHGPLGFLETKYHVVERVRNATEGDGSGALTGAATPVLGVVKGVATTVVGAILIVFLTLFMLLEGPAWRVRLMELVPDARRGSIERVGAGIYKAVSGFVIGNLLASFLAGLVATVILLVAGVPYAVPLGLFVAIIEVVPYLGPLVATVVMAAVAFTQGVAPGLVVLVSIVVYHMIEGHTLRPFIYGRAVDLSPLAVLIAIILGTEIAGILGALAAIPVAGAIQVILAELITHRPSAIVDPEAIV